ncbi:MAG TPA: hypothetical protein VIC34_09985 [Croceibacterium sp.]|jgi:beta-glucosidase
MTTRRNVLAGLAASTTMSARARAVTSRRSLPRNLLWGAAISAHQSEGNNVNSDSWLLASSQATLVTGDFRHERTN